MIIQREKAASSGPDDSGPPVGPPVDSYSAMVKGAGLDIKTLYPLLETIRDEENPFRRTHGLVRLALAFAEAVSRVTAGETTPTQKEWLDGALDAFDDALLHKTVSTDQTELRIEEAGEAIAWARVTVGRTPGTIDASIRVDSPEYRELILDVAAELGGREVAG